MVYVCVCGDQEICIPDKRASLDASVLVCNFLDFISEYELSAHLCGFSSAQVRTLCFWVAYVAPIVVPEEMQLLFEELCSRCLWSDELQKYCYRSTGAALEPEAHGALTAVEVLRSSVPQTRLAELLRERKVTRARGYFRQMRGEKQVKVWESHANHLYFCRCEAFRAGRALAMQLESQCTGHRQSRECDSRTPTTPSDLAVSLRATVGKRKQKKTQRRG